jgi:gamma-glutamyltranspeptidase/glutathione hydrolase
MTSTRQPRWQRALFVALLLPIALCMAPLARGAAAIASPDAFGTEVAAAVLARGGNAVDAAVAVGFVLAVTYPEAGNLGGGGFMTLRVNGRNEFLDYRETAPAAATRDMYLDTAGNVAGDASLVGHQASGVPGTVAGLWAAHQRHGSLPWRELLQPAIRLAREGFEPPLQLRERIAEFDAEVKGRTNFARYFGAARSAARFRQPELAATLERIARRGAAEFYRGRTARLLVAEMRRGGGIISARDLAAYQPVWREPLTARWRDYEVVSAPPPSSGGIALLQLLGMKDALAPQFSGVALNSPQYVHLVAEISKRVFADRAEYLGDPDFVDVPARALVDPTYITRRAAEVSVDAPSPTPGVRPGLVEPRHTTHYSILDAAGNAVSNTYTLNGSFGSGVVVAGAGFLLNNEMDDFSIRPGTPNLYGVVGGSANAIAPGKRMLSSMTPTLLLRDGKVAMVVGTPGGSTIITSVFQAIVNIVDYGQTPAEAAAAPKFHHQLLPPNRIIYSQCCMLDAATITALQQRGYEVERSSWEFGDLQIISVAADGAVTAGADPRGRGTVQVITTANAATSAAHPASRNAAAGTALHPAAAARPPRRNPSVDRTARPQATSAP